MNRKIMLVGLAVVSAAVLALPATASALVPLHLNPTPAGVQTIDDTGPNPILSLANGSTYGCETFHGSATFNEGGATGSMSLTLGKCSGATCNPTTTTLPFHLVTLPGEQPGVLITTNNGHFSPFLCSGLFSITGNGLIGTIISPECGQVSNEVTLDFNATAHGVQEHTTVADTNTLYTLKAMGASFALDARGTLTLSEETELECT